MAKPGQVIDDATVELFNVDRKTRKSRKKAAKQGHH
jgi:hypothetical protein